MKKSLATLALLSLLLPASAHAYLELTSGRYVPYGQDTCRLDIVAAGDGKVAVRHVANTWKRVRNGLIYQYRCEENGAVLKRNSDGTYSGRMSQQIGEYTHVVLYPIERGTFLYMLRTENYSISPDEFLEQYSQGNIPSYRELAR